MLHKTRGIVLHSFSYNDKYTITQIYTEEFGQIAYLTARTKGKKTKIAKSLFYSLSVLDLEVEHYNLREIHRLKEAQSNISLSGILFDPLKSSICIFLAEFISKVTKDVQPNKPLFEFICQSVHIFDLLEKGAANFHLVFMIRLSRFLGFYPDATGFEPGMYFDMQNGIFVGQKPYHPHFLPPNESDVFVLLLRMNYENMHTYILSRHDRVTIIQQILRYYRLHLYDFPDLKSLEILQDVFE